MIPASPSLLMHRGDENAPPNLGAPDPRGAAAPPPKGAALPSPKPSPKGPLSPRRTPPKKEKASRRRVSWGPSPASDREDSITKDIARLPSSATKLRQSMLEVDAIYTLDDLSRRATPNRHSDVWTPGGGMTPGGMTPGGATPGGATTTPAAAAAPADGATPSPLRLALSAVLEAVLDITLLEAEVRSECAPSPRSDPGTPRSSVGAPAPSREVALSATSASPSTPAPSTVREVTLSAMSSTPATPATVREVAPLSATPRRPLSFGTPVATQTVREIALSPVLAGGWPALFEDSGSAPPWVEELCCGAGAGPGWLPACSCAADLDDDGRERSGTRLVDLDRGVRRYDGLDDDASDCSDDSDAVPYVNDEELALILDPVLSGGDGACDGCDGDGASETP